MSGSSGVSLSIEKREWSYTVAMTKKLEAVAKRFEAIILPLIVGVYFLLEIADTFNLSDFVPSKYMPLITLLVVAFILKTVISMRLEYDRLHHETVDLHCKYLDLQKVYADLSHKYADLYNKYPVLPEHVSTITFKVRGVRIWAQLGWLPAARNNGIEQIEEATIDKDM
jgi:hypothetical protein